MGRMKKGDKVRLRRDLTIKEILDSDITMHTEMWVLVTGLVTGNETLTIKSIRNDIDIIKLEEDRVFDYPKDWFEVVEEYRPKFKWRKLTSIRFESEEKNRITMGYLKEYEIMYNYERYGEEVDITLLDWDNKDTVKYTIFYSHNYKKYKLARSVGIQEINALHFSTEEHAENFIKLLEENV